MTQNERKLPTPNLDIHIWRDYTPDTAYEKAQQDMLDAGYRLIPELEVLSPEEIIATVEVWYETSPLKEALATMGAQAQLNHTNEQLKEG